MDKKIKISGYVLKFGDEIEPGVKIAKDCKITLPKNTVMTHEFNPYKVLGIGDFVKDEHGIKYEGECNMFELATGGVVKKRNGNMIQEFDIKEVSIIPIMEKQVSDVNSNEKQMELCSCGLDWFHYQYELDDNKCENCGKRIRM